MKMQEIWSPNITTSNGVVVVRKDSDIWWIVIHTMETDERGDTAEAVASNWFKLAIAKASAHYCVDSNSIVRCVKNNNIAWAAPGMNLHGIQYELAGRAAQSSTEWSDPFSMSMLQIAAKQAAVDAKKYGIPPVHLTVAEIRAGKRGFAGHIDATNAFSGGRGHTDPGTNFPWDKFLGMVQKEMGLIGAATAPAKTNESSGSTFPLPAGHWFGLNDGTVFSHSGVREVDRVRIKAIQSKLGISADGIFGPQSESSVKKKQSELKIAVDGRVGPQTWKAMKL